MQNRFDVVIIGAGAAGLMCGVEASKRGRKVLIIDKSNKPGKKILMSGGGRCNFTNLHIHPDKYISSTKNFVKSALKRYTQFDFIKLVKKHKIPYHEKTLGQLFCDNKSVDILNMLLNECDEHGVKTILSTNVNRISQKSNEHFLIQTDKGDFDVESLVIASGGLSIPTMGSSPFGYQVAEQFGLDIIPTRAGLVPFTLHEHDKQKFADISGVSLESTVYNKSISFNESILFTHRGLSGPAILQISSYWNPGEYIDLNFLPNLDIVERITQDKNAHGKRIVRTYLNDIMPKRLTDIIISNDFIDKKIGDLSKKDLLKIKECLHNFKILPNGTEGYRTAEVTIGGVNCSNISSKTMESKIKGLYFIGEVVDVSGWLGGYNFQWAWSSGWVAGQYV